MKLWMRCDKTFEQYSPAVENNQNQRLTGSLSFAFSTLFEFKNQVLKVSLQHCCHKSKPLFFQPMDYLMKLKCMILTTNVLSVSVKTRKCAVWNSKSLPILFQISYQSNQSFNWFENPRIWVQNLKLLKRWNKIPKMLLKSHGQQFCFQISSCFSAFF